MSFGRGLKIVAVLTILVLAIVASLNSRATLSDYAIAQTPLYLGESQPPLMMLVMSRDEQLFNKAYADYTDLSGPNGVPDGVLDTTYNDNFSYAGYFDPNRCYTDSTSLFAVAGAATGTNSHSCSGNWSGNFLNWVTMSRLDVLRYVLYGGKRSVDTAATTTLERAAIPSDLHAWVKVYSGSDIGSFTPFSAPTSFCNVTNTTNSTAPSAPLMRVAQGTYTEWASTALYQCRTRAQTSNAQTLNDIPGAGVAVTDYTVRVQACVNAPLESFCRAYTGGSGVTRYKPAGLLQQYGENGALRFGLISGSYDNPRSGGVLRKNIGRIAGNGTSSTCTAGDEISLVDGTFCANTAGSEGIISNIDRFALTQWNGSKWSDCNDYGILNRSGNGGNGFLKNPGTGGGYSCSAWGNPLAEMYAEALRYIEGGKKTSAYNSGNDLSGLVSNVNWQDPYRTKGDGGNSYCAKCSILVLSSGLPSFDSDETGSVSPLSDAVTSTNAVGAAEGISGSYFAGRAVASPPLSMTDQNATTYSDTCTTKAVGSLGQVLGICPDSPSTEGSYFMAGLAYQANTNDLRASKAPVGRPSGVKNTVRTYAVEFESLPKIQIPVGASTITISPLCQANNSGTAVASSNGWRNCFLGAVGVGTKTSQVSPYQVYGRNVTYSGSNLVAGSFSVVWEDSLWGNDHDNDVVTMISWCTGATCSDDTNPVNNASFSGKDICWNAPTTGICGTTRSPTVAANEVLVRVEILSAYAGNALLNGFNVTGSNSDGTYRSVLRPGNSDGSIITAQATSPSNWTAPTVYKFTAGNGASNSLQSPLWYAAKFGGFNDTDGNGTPDTGEWDSRASGTPDNYFLARSPSKLRDEISRIFSSVAGDNAPTSGATSGARITGDSLTVDTSFAVPQDSNDWTGNVKGYSVDTATGGAGAELWNAANVLPADSARRIFVTKSPTTYATDGTVSASSVAGEFLWGNLCSGSATCSAQEKWSALGGVGSSVLGLLNYYSLDTWAQSIYGADISGNTLGINLVSYLRGLPTSEIRNGGRLRSRSTPLGDIVNSSAEIASSRDDYGYGAWASATAPAWAASLGASYKTYVSNKAASYASPVAYVGANDGMLHAFDGKTGVEKFAFIPSVSRSHLYSLADPQYTHQYFVDGLVTAGDVATTASGGWKTVLVGSTGGGSGTGAPSAGPKSVFGLDVSTPGSFGAPSALWELVGGSGAGQNTNLGNVLGKPIIVPVNVQSGATTGPRWMAIFGNGANSASGAPVLFVVDAYTGRLWKTLKPSNAVYASQNGLVNVVGIAAQNTNGTVDTVYGGDLQGNLWKFDLSDPSAASWRVTNGTNDAPLFTAGIPAQGSTPAVLQPITGGLEVASGPAGGVMIYFGTGRYFAEGDNALVTSATNSIQSLYGIWDNGTRVGTSTGTAPATNGRNSLVAQSVSATGSSATYATRGVSSNGVGYPTKRGWFVDLTLPTVIDNTSNYGERFFGTPRIQNGQVFFTTFVTAGADCGSGGGFNWLYGLDLLTGAGSLNGLTLSPGGASVCTSNCGAIALNATNQTSTPVRNTSVLLPKPSSPTICSASDPACAFSNALDSGLASQQCTLVLRAVGAVPLYLPRPCGRQSWRQIR